MFLTNKFQLNALGLNRSLGLLLVTLAIVSRIPAIMDDTIIMDGDECIIGLMAKWMSEGKVIYPYFIGQSYGFSLLEIMPVSIFYKLFGVADYFQKLVGALFFAASCYFLFRGLMQILKSEVVAFLVIMLFVFTPVWQQWSLRLNGGYISALLISSFLFYYAIKQSKHNILKAIIFGVLLVVLFECQRLWLPFGVLLVWFWIKQQKNQLKLLMTLLLSVAISTIPFFIVKSNIVPVWQPTPIVIQKEIFLNNLLGFLNNLKVYFSGTFYYGEYHFRGYTNVSVAHFYVVLSILSPLAVFRVRKLEAHQKYLAYLLFLSLMITLASTFFLNGFLARYLMPLQAELILFYTLTFANELKKVSLTFLLGVIIFISLIASAQTNLEPYEWQTKKQMKELCQHLESNNYKGIYCTNGLMQWQIEYYSQQRVHARTQTWVDRFQDNIKYVDSIRIHHRSQAAIVGFVYHLPKEFEVKADVRMKPYYIVPAETDSLVRKFDFLFD